MSVIFCPICILGLVVYYLTTEAVSSRNIVIVVSDSDAGNVSVMLVILFMSLSFLIYPHFPLMDCLFFIADFFTALCNT